MKTSEDNAFNSRDNICISEKKACNFRRQYERSEENMESRKDNIGN